MKFFFSFVFEKIVVAVISRTNRTATIWARNPIIKARLPKNSSNVNRSANTAPPGHPVPFAKPIGFLTSLIFGQPWTKNKAPRATRPTRAATSGYAAKTMGLPPRTLSGGRGRKTFHGGRRDGPRGYERDPSWRFPLAHPRVTP